MEPSMFDGLIVKGALMAVGGGIGAVIVLIIGRVIVNYVLDKYGYKKKNGKPNGAPDYVTADICVAHHEEVKDLIRAEFEDVNKEMKASLARIYDRIHEHVTDYKAHSGGQ